MKFETTIITVGISGNRSALLRGAHLVHAPLSCAPVDRDRRRTGMFLDLCDLGVFDVRGGTPSHAPAGASAFTAAELGNPVPGPERRQLLPIQIQGKSGAPPGSYERRRLATG